MNGRLVPGICRFPALSIAGCLAVLVWVLGGSTAFALSHPVDEVVLAPDRLTVEEIGDSSGPSPAEIVVRYPGALPGPEGAPDLPLLPVWVEIPAGVRAVGVKARPVGVEELGRVWVRPVAPDVRPGDEPREAVADPAIYEAPGMYPGAWAALGPAGTMRGHRLVSVLVAPARWDPATGRLVRASSVGLELELAAGESGEVVERHRVVKEIEEKFEAAAGRMIRGFQPAPVTGTLGVAGSSSLAGTGPAGAGPYQPTFRPTTDGSAVEYVIVTSDALAPEFERLAEWKTKKGVQAAVRTVEWIDQTYPNGVDQAERIRFFIRDAYQNWGTLYVLLGGDSDVIPVRYGETTFFLANGERIPADIYYGCLDGNWNDDGDARFGEGLTATAPSDSADLIFEVVIGRAPVSTVEQVETFIDKTLLYEMEPPAPARYPASILVLAERLFSSTHGADIAEAALAFVPPWMRVVRLYEESASYPGSIELTRQAALDSINAGFGIVHHVGHGYRNTMSVGSGTLNNADSDNLTNAPLNSLVFAINCSSASIDFNSIGERWVKNANGGSIIYLGTSRLAFVTPSNTYQNEWYEKVFVDSVTTFGLATDMSRAILVPASVQDNSIRWNLMATTLLGDPEVDLYTNAVVPIQVTHPASVPIGSAPITVTVRAQGAAVAGATVTLYREGEVYARAETAANGNATLPVTANTPGSLVLTAHKSYYRPYSATLPVTTAAGPYLHVQSMLIDDDVNGASSGDGDGQADAGETIELTVILKNGGGAQATGVSGLLTAEDPENALTITQATVSYGTLAAGGSSGGSGVFVIAIDPAAPVAYQPILELEAAGNQGTWRDPIALPLRRPYIEHYAHTADDAPPRGNGNGVVEAGEQIYYRVTLRNTGQDRATGVAATLRALDRTTGLPHGQVTVSDGSASFGTIAQGGTVEGDRFVFTLAGGADPSTVLLELTLNDNLGPIRLELLDVIAPLPADSLAAFGSPTSIRLQWKPSASADRRGYDIFRSSSPGGPFQRVNTYSVDGSAAFEDPGLAPLTRYYYQVVARDSSMNASVPSGVVSGTTNPPATPGWPLEIGQQSSSSAIVVDIDGGSHTEILCGADMQYAWHGDGTEVVDGDDDDRTSGPFSLYGKNVMATGFGATPAAGNIDLDGYLEVANIGFYKDSLFVWDHQGVLKPGWPKYIQSDFNFGSLALPDLDRDGDLEVVVWAGNGGRLFAWHHNGVEVVDGDNNPATYGLLTNRILGTSFNYGSVTVGNLDADPELEVVVPVHKTPDNTGGIYAFNIDGSSVPGWPFFTGGGGFASEISSSPAIADLDGDGDEEVVFAAERNGGSIYVLNSNGQPASGWPRQAAALTEYSRLPSPVVADLDRDGFLDVIFPATDGRLWAWNRNGQVLPGFPATFSPEPRAQATQSTPSVGDIDNDGWYEILFGDESGKVHAYNHDGTLAAGFPIQLGGEVNSTPALWDVDRDNMLEVVVVCFDANVYVFDVPAEFNPDRLPWPFFRHDVRNTGRYSTSIQIGIEEPAPVVAVSQAALYPAFPNPFNPATRIGFAVPGEAGGARPVTLSIYDVSGRLVRKLVEGPVGTGRHEVSWDGRGVDGRVAASGVYVARIAIGDFVATQKLTMVR